MSTVLVTGATGFVAQHTVHHLLAKGYTVIGTVRSQDKGEKIAKLFNNSSFSFEVIPNLESENAFDEAFARHQDIKYVIHVASPVDMGSKDLENEMILAAVNGTVNLLRNVEAKLPNAERFVYTSSIVAVISTIPENPQKSSYNYKDWNPITLEQGKQHPFQAYCASKTFAERAAWDFVSTHKPRYGFTTVNPSFIFGPQLFEEYVAPNLNFSNEFLNVLINSKKGDVSTKYSEEKKEYVSVSDVAKLLVLGFELESTKGKRLIANSAACTDQTILNLLNEIPELKGKIATGDAINKDTVGTKATIDNTNTIKYTGIEFAPLKPIVLAVAGQVLEHQKTHN